MEDSEGANDGEISFSDWKKLKDSKNPMKTTDKLSVPCQSQYISNKWIQPSIPPLMPPPPVPAGLFIPPSFPETSPLIPQLAPFVMARNHPYFNKKRPPLTRKPGGNQQEHQGRPATKEQTNKAQVFPQTQTHSNKQTENINSEAVDAHISDPLQPANPKPNEPQFKPSIYVQRGNRGGKNNWIPKPTMPPLIDAAATPEQQRENQRLWRDYRKAMKPFKCRDFLNAKRTIQRLGKKNKHELDEKELGRLERAEEAVLEHKKKLNERAMRRSTKIQNEVFSRQNAEQVQKVTDNNTIFINQVQKGNPSFYNQHLQNKTQHNWKGISTDNQQKNYQTNISNVLVSDTHSLYPIGNNDPIGLSNTPNILSNIPLN